MNEVQLKPGYYWECPYCARENFYRPMQADLSDSEKHESAVMLGWIQEWETIAQIPADRWECINVMPKSVLCPGCTMRSETTFPHTE